jgi:hypothetical protein
MRCVTALRLLAGSLPSLLLTVVLVVGCRGEKPAELKETSKASGPAPIEACKQAMTNLGDGRDGRYEATVSACAAACDGGDSNACKFLKAAEALHAANASAAGSGAGSAAGSGAGSGAAGSGAGSAGSGSATAAGSGSASERVADPKMLEAAKKGGAALQRQQERGKQKATNVP